MADFPRTNVGGVSVSRIIIGTNWMLGWSHTTKAKDDFIKSYQTPKSIANILEVFMKAGVDSIMGMPHQKLVDALTEAEQRVGRKIVRIWTPNFKLTPKDDAEYTPEQAFDLCKEKGASICMPHQSVTDALMDKMTKTIRDLGKYTKMMRDRGMVPGLSTHMPETIIYADAMNADIESYIQIYNAIGFLMQIEVDWVMRVISKAKKPVMTIKPFAAGRIHPAVGLAFNWNTIRDQDMVTVGCTTPDEAREVIDLSLTYLARRLPENVLQKTRSKKSLEA